MLFEGAPYIFLFSFLFVAIIAIAETVRSRKSRILRRVVLVFVLGLMLSGVKLLPTLQFLADHPRTHVQQHEQGANDKPMGGISLIQNGLLFADYADLLPFEDGAYVGLLPIVFGGVGLLASGRSKWQWYLTGALFLVIAMGDDGVPGLWGFLHGLPVVKQTIFPQRYLFGVLFPIALAAGFGLDWMRSRMGRAGTVAAVGVLALIASHYTMRNYPVYVSMFDGKPLDTTVLSAAPLKGHVRMPSEYHSLQGLVRGYGVINAHPYIPHPDPAVVEPGDSHYRGEYAAVGAAGVDLVYWSPNIIDLDVKLHGRPDRVVINQNYSDGWIVTEGDATTSSDSGRLAADVFSSGRVEIRYRPPHLILGATVSGVGLVALLGLALGRRSPLLHEAEP